MCEVSIAFSLLCMQGGVPCDMQGACAAHLQAVLDLVKAGHAAGRLETDGNAPRWLIAQQVALSMAVRHCCCFADAAWDEPTAAAFEQALEVLAQVRCEGGRRQGIVWRDGGCDWSGCFLRQECNNCVIISARKRISLTCRTPLRWSWHACCCVLWLRQLPSGPG